MRLSRKKQDERIIKLYKNGRSYKTLQKRYHRSPNKIAELVRGMEVTCTACGKPKGKLHFHAHHPDRVNRPNYTVPLCPSCHAKEEARIRKEQQNQPETLATTPNSNLIPKHTPAILPTASLVPLSPTVKKVAIGIATAAIVDTLFPTFFPKLITSFQNGNEYYQEKKRRWRNKNL